MRTLLLSLILGLFCAQLTLSATAAPIEHIYAFGDSYSDNGASDRLTHEMLEKGIKDAQRLPGELYWQGRWSNGPTAVEVLAQRLGAQLTDYAVGGAKSGRNNYYAWMTPYQDTGLSGQIDQYLGGLNGQPADPGSLLHLYLCQRLLRARRLQSDPTSGAVGQGQRRTGVRGRQSAGQGRSQAFYGSRLDRAERGARRSCRWAGRTGPPLPTGLQ